MWTRSQRLVQVDQKPIGRTPRSNLATYTGLFDHVRKLFAATPDARRRRFDAGRFSFNVAKGRCETCEGEGFVSVELLFMPSVYAPCPTCHGARYNEATLKVRWNGQQHRRGVADDGGRRTRFFAGEDAVPVRCSCCTKSAWATCALASRPPSFRAAKRNASSWQPNCNAASAAQCCMCSTSRPRACIAADVDRLLVQLQRLVDAGNTVVMIEHDMRAVAQATGSSTWDRAPATRVVVWWRSAHPPTSRVSLPVERPPFWWRSSGAADAAQSAERCSASRSTTALSTTLSGFRACRSTPIITVSCSTI